MKYLTIFSAVILISLFLGCTDILDKFPLDEPSNETFYTNALEIERGVNTCYNRLQEIDHRGYVYPLVLDCMSDVGFIRVDSDYKTLAKGEHDARSGIAESTWRRAYQGLMRSTLMLSVIEEKKDLLTDAQYKLFKGQVLFFRAYYHSRLITYFGDVPMVLEPILTISEAKSVTRTPKAEVLHQIYIDFDVAAELLPVNYTENENIGRVTKGAAYAYKARIALYFGDWSAAAISAKKVIDLGVYDLYPEYGKLFISEGLTNPSNKEIILKREYAGAMVNDYHSLMLYMMNRSEAGWAALVPSQSLVDSYHCVDGKNITDSPLFDKAKRFENRDPRLSLSIAFPGSRYGDIQFESHYDSLTCYNYVTNKRVRNTDCVSLNQYTSFTGYHFRKYADMDYRKDKTRASYPIILCRYAEVLLTYAEAKIELGEIDQSVIDAINKIRRDRIDVKMPAYSLNDFADLNTARLKLRHERKIELAFEGFRYTDLRRWGLANTYLNRPILGRPFKGALTDWPDVTFDTNGEPEYPGYENYAPHPSIDYRVVENKLFTPNRDELLPVPTSERNLNSNLDQNPGY